MALHDVEVCLNTQMALCRAFDERASQSHRRLFRDQQSTRLCGRRRCWASTSRTVKVQELLKALRGFGDGFGLWEKPQDRGRL